MSNLIKNSVLGLVLINLSMFAINSEKDSLRLYNAPTVEVIGDKHSALKSIPGSVSLVTQQELLVRKPLSSNEMLQSIPGLNIVDEEGAGLRLNLGIRGLDPDRSRNILVMEDGVPVSLAPYGEPEMYYTPSIDRMSSIEVLKGSGSIIHGPQTIGGVINYLTKNPPEESTTSFNFTAGSGGYINLNAGYGNTFGSSGILTEVYHRRADNIGLTNYSIFDFSTKARFKIDDVSSYIIKIGAYDEISNSTYVGLTQNMFDRGGFYEKIAPDDELKINRYSANLTYKRILSGTTILNTTLYGYNTTRFWKRQDFSRTPDANNLNGDIYGDTEIPSGAIYMKDGTGNRDREFKVAGLQPNILYENDFFGLRNEITAGIRLHYEQALEKRINGTKATAYSGELINDEERTGMAFSAYLHDRININDNFIISPGVRYEYFEYERKILRNKSVDTLIQSVNSINSIIPGFGANYNFNNFTVFTGFHRGFAPPRIKDAITNAGEALDLDAELSWNYEFGIRTKPLAYLNLEATIYYLDFENQIIPVSESSGGLGTGLINGGETVHKGVELSGIIDFAEIFSLNKTLSLQANFSLNDSYYSEDRFIQNGDEKVNIINNKLPYAPEYTFNAIATYQGKSGFGFNLTLVYIGERYADELNTINATNDGLSGLMPSYFTADATVSYLIRQYGVRAFLSVKNISDERYIASRRPQGIKVGTPRFISIGLNYDL